MLNLTTVSGHDWCHIRNSSAGLADIATRNHANLYARLGQGTVFTPLHQDTVQMSSDIIVHSPCARVRVQNSVTCINTKTLCRN